MSDAESFSGGTMGYDEGKNGRDRDDTPTADFDWHEEVIKARNAAEEARDAAEDVRELADKTATKVDELISDSRDTIRTLNELQRDVELVTRNVQSGFAHNDTLLKDLQEQIHNVSNGQLEIHSKIREQTKKIDALLKLASGED